MRDWFLAAWDVVVNAGSAVFDMVVRLGIIGFVVGATVRAYGRYRQRKRELKGLLKLLALETRQNEKQLLTYGETPSWITQAPSHTLSTEA